MTGDLMRQLAARFALIEDPVTALNMAMVAVQQAPGDAAAQLALGHAAERARHVEEAIEAYLAAILLNAAEPSELVEHSAQRLLSCLKERPDRVTQVTSRLAELGERVTLPGSVVQLLGRLLLSRGALDRAARLALLHLVERGAGWRQSLRSEVAADAVGEPLPLYTYPCIAYLEQIDWSGSVVFEYGAGQSTLFWARRCRQVHAVDNDLAWTERFREAAPGNVALGFAEDAEFARAVLACPVQPDLIIIDGQGHRYDCAVHAIERLAPGGAILLDNADSHPETARRLREADLIEVDFAGLKPTELAVSTTSLFLDKAFRPRMRNASSPQPWHGARVLRSEWDRPG
jgi:hypothetical protein